MVLPEDLKNDIYKLSINPFILERLAEYEKAIDSHKKAIEVLSMAAEKFRKSSSVRKINRKMFERQVDLHRERLSYLESLKSKGSFDGIILAPTALDVGQELQRENEDNSPWTLSQVCLPNCISILRLTYPL
jgi:recombinational DNA repair ATPase RecF